MGIIYKVILEFILVIKGMGVLTKTGGYKYRMYPNREKARLRKAKLLAKISDMRRDFQQKLSTRLIRENQAIGLDAE